MASSDASWLVPMDAQPVMILSLLKKLGVPARDATVILGHSCISVTHEIYTHVDDEAQRDALDKMHGLFHDEDEG